MHNILVKSNRERLNCEFFVMMNAHDTWNRELVKFYQRYIIAIEQIVGFAPGLHFVEENRGLGRDGLHVYLNDLAAYSKGDWIVYFCDDHHVVVDDWDEKLLEYVRQRKLNPHQIHCIVPKFDNAGAMNHIISRGYYETLNHVGQNGWIDSYLNDVNALIPADRIHKVDDEWFHDFTHDKPDPMDPIHTKISLSSKVKDLSKKGSPEYNEQVIQDADKLNNQIKRGRR